MSNLANNTVTMEEILELVNSLPEAGLELIDYVNDLAETVPANAFISLPIFRSVKFTVAKEIGASAFRGGTELLTADFPAVTSIGAGCFMLCTKLESINLPLLESVPNFGLPGLSALKQLVLPSVETIAQNAFQLGGMALVDLPVATSIGNWAFQFCQSLTTLILRSTTMCALENTAALTGTPINSGAGYIYVPAALVNTYKANSVWGNFANSFRSLESYTVDGTITGALDETKI